MSPVLSRGLRDIAVFLGIIALCYLALYLFGTRPSPWWYTVPFAVALGMALRTAQREVRYRKDTRQDPGAKEA